MRRRLTIAILLLVAATLLITTLSSYFFVRRAAISTSQQELSGEALAISRAFTSEVGVTRASFRRELRVIARAGAFSGIGVIKLYPDGTIQGIIPSGLDRAQLRVPVLLTGQQVSGHTSSLLVYSAVPTPAVTVTTYTPVLVITRQTHDPANGLRYFGLVSAIGLAVAALVVAGLARRFTRPLVAAVTATRRIADGDLDAKVAVTEHEIPEFAQLAESINTMGGNLVRARNQERQFLLSVSHELRTPLTSIRGYADAVIDGAIDDPTAAAVVIASESRRLERLVQDLLDLARLDAHRFSFDLQPVDAVDVVVRMVEGFHHRAAELGLELIAAPATVSPLWVVADADRLGQIVANLIENATSFARHRIVVGAGAVVPPGSAAAISPESTTGTVPGSNGSTSSAPVPAIWVVDDGPGIPAHELTLVFDRHFSSDRVQGRRKGAGLGLAIVAELAAAMGAGVEAQSPVTTGTAVGTETGSGTGTGVVVWLRPAAPGSGSLLPTRTPIGQ
jgi:two-component system, OmpR family, sensor kinase